MPKNSMKEQRGGIPLQVYKLPALKQNQSVVHFTSAWLKHVATSYPSVICE